MCDFTDGGLVKRTRQTISYSLTINRLPDHKRNKNHGVELYSKIKKLLCQKTTFS